MFCELIYTRCRQGIDILKGGNSGDGFKVYSCTPELMNGETDLPFLLKFAGEKQSYSESAFMDDAYLYFVPDRGDNFLLNFHPVSHDPDAKGDYAHRGGNFVNQLLAGDFTSIYPYKLFRDNVVWTAQQKGEAYYYENTPEPLPARSDIENPAGQFRFDELRKFIDDGRKDALRAAVSFLVSQYEMEPENRKFLVIRDESSTNLEKWIAAIECAFSPRMASSIPFATRMDRFASTNRYTVNSSGVYQTQIDLQNPNHKLRYRAMIVGVDERDTSNIAAARPLANSSFVLLDGKEKRALFDAKPSSGYFNLITSFNDSHRSFCCEFLQTINILAPSSDIYTFYETYLRFESPSLPSAICVGKMLSHLGKYRLFNSRKLQSIYKRVAAELPRFIEEDFPSALQIMNWLRTVAVIVDDQSANQRLTEIVCGVFGAHVFVKSNAEKTYALWSHIQNSEFTADAAGYIVDPTTLRANASAFEKFRLPDAIAFVTIYFDSAAFLGTVGTPDMKSIVSYGLQRCYRQDDSESAGMVLKALANVNRSGIQDMVLAVVGGTDEAFSKFVIGCYIKYDAIVVKSETAMLQLIKRLNEMNAPHLIKTVFVCRINYLDTPHDVEQFVNVMEVQQLNKEDKKTLFEAVDGKIRLNEKGWATVARSIQHRKPQDAKCGRSAHLYALEILSDINKRRKFAELFEKLSTQGFPCETNQSYVHALNNLFLKGPMNQGEFVFLVQLYKQAPWEYFADLASAVVQNISKWKDKWSILIDLAAKTHDAMMYDVIVRTLVERKANDRYLSRLGDMLSKTSQPYFKRLAERVREDIRSNKTQSGFRRFFNFFLGGDEDDKRGKK
jgi:hypothetical protein